MINQQIMVLMSGVLEATKKHNESMLEEAKKKNEQDKAMLEEAKKRNEQDKKHNKAMLEEAKKKNKAMLEEAKKKNEEAKKKNEQDKKHNKAMLEEMKRKNEKDDERVRDKYRKDNEYQKAMLGETKSNNEKADKRAGEMLEETKRKNKQDEKHKTEKLNILRQYLQQSGWRRLNFYPGIFQALANTMMATGKSPEGILGNDPQTWIHQNNSEYWSKSKLLRNSDHTEESILRGISLLSDKERCFKKLFSTNEKLAIPYSAYHVQMVENNIQTSSAINDENDNGSPNMEWAYNIAQSTVRP